MVVAPVNCGIVFGVPLPVTVWALAPRAAKPIMINRMQMRFIVSLLMYSDFRIWTRFAAIAQNPSHHKCETASTEALQVTGRCRRCRTACLRLRYGLGVARQQVAAADDRDTAKVRTPGYDRFRITEEIRLVTTN